MLYNKSISQLKIKTTEPDDIAIEVHIFGRDELQIKNSQPHLPHLEEEDISVRSGPKMKMGTERLQFPSTFVHYIRHDKNLPQAVLQIAGGLLPKLYVHCVHLVARWI